MTRIHWLAASAMALVAVPLAAQSIGDVQPAAPVAARADARLRCLRGPRPRRPAPKPRPSLISSDQFAKAGLQPGGDMVNGKRQWTQAVPLLKSEWQRPPQVSVDLRRQGDAAHPGRSNRGPRTDQRRQSAGHRRRAARLRRLRRQGARAQLGRFQGPDLRGKILVMLVNDPDFEGGEGRFRRQGDDLLRPLDL